MIGSLTAWGLTLFLGPGMFVIIGAYSNPDLPTFPIDVVDGVGDIVFLPLLNAVIVAMPGFPFILSSWAWSALVSSVITALITFEAVYWQSLDEWSRPSKGEANSGTWYHAGFVFVQTTIILVAVSRLPTNPALWSLLAGYLVCATYSLTKL